MGKLFDSKFKVMEPLWNDGSQPAGALARRAGGQLWLENTLIGTVLILWAVCLAGLFSSMSLGSPLSLYALAPEGPAVPMTAAFVTSHGKADPKTAHLKPIVLEESGLDLSRSVSISTRFTVKVGASFIRTFHTGNLFVEDHNAFKIIVSNTNGAKYKYVIVNDHG